MDSNCCKKLMYSKNKETGGPRYCGLTKSLFAEPVAGGRCPAPHPARCFVVTVETHKALRGDRCIHPASSPFDWFPWDEVTSDWRKVFPAASHPRATHIHGPVVL